MHNLFDFFKIKTAYNKNAWQANKSIIQKALN